MFWPFSPSYPECSASDIDGKSYDYVVVGGGTAACAVASRLSEDFGVTVLLISKGKVKDDWINSIPIIGNANDGKGSDIDTLWSEPDDAWNGAKIRAFTSQALGGASTVNGLMHVRGAPGVYNHWAALGNDQWSFAKCEPYFRKLENAASRPGASDRGHDGPVYLRQSPMLFAVDKYIQQAARDVNLPLSDDVNDPKAPAAALFSVETMIDKFGYRHSSYAAYLPKSVALDRKDRLTICSGVVATRLQVGQSDKVTGVYILDHVDRRSGKEYLVQARREVIVCCGALFTPQLLMLSGIGPREHVEQHRIPLVRDLPGVGANLQDHVAIAIAFQVRLVDSYIRMLNPLVAIWVLCVYIFTKTGLLATAGGRMGVWINSNNIDDETMTMKPPHGDTRGEEVDATDASVPENVPDIELLFVNATRDFEKGKGYCAFQTTLLQPFSTGRIELASSDPLAMPKLYHQYITDSRDWMVARKATRFAMNYIEQFRKTDYPFNSPWQSAPGVKRGTVNGSWRDVSDDQIDAFLREHLTSFFHFTSSCRMASLNDGGVVDQNLKVYGFSNLRIADASVFPKGTSGHPVAPIYMVAERCADFIKKDWAKTD